MQALMGMIQSSTRDKVRRLHEEHRKASMPRGQFYVTALTHGSFGYELACKDEQGSLFEDPAIVDSIWGTMSVIETTTKKQGSTLRVESGSNALSLDSHSVDTGFDNICLSDIIEKEDEITATFQGSFIESGKFEYTDVEGHLLHSNISEDLTGEDIIHLTHTYAGQDCRLQVIRRIVNYSNGHKKENVELTGITDLASDN